MIQPELKETSETAQSLASEEAHGVPRRVWIPALVFVSLLLVFVVAAYFWTPTMTQDQRNLIRFATAFLAGLSVHFLGGVALLEWGLPKSKAVRLSISATSGIAVLIFFYVYAPYWYTAGGVDSDYIEVGFAEDMPLERVVRVVAESRNVTITFDRNCDQSTRAAIVEKGNHKGSSIKEFLENLKQRLKESGINYSVKQEGARYEINCQ
jgi:hypothetical protein